MINLKKLLANKMLLLLAFSLNLAACNSGGTTHYDNGQQNITWNECNNAHAGDADYQCATLTVPLDYSNPSLGNTTIGFVKYAKTSNKNYLFYNSGGPWSVNTGLDFESRLPTSVLDKYTIIAFDPRGVGLSQNLTCDIQNIKQQMDAITTTSMSSFKQLLSLHDQMYTDCTEQFNGFQKFMGTNLTAQDMDHIRQQLNVDKISFLGYSYGTQLGDEYLMTYPEHINKMILDGNVGPSRDVNIFFQSTVTALDNGLNYFFGLCDKNPNCLLYPDSKAQFSAATALVESGVVTTQNGDHVSLNNFYYWVRRYLNKDNMFYQIANLVHDINTNHMSPDGFSTSGQTQRKQNYILASVLCTDYNKTTNQNLIDLFANAQTQYSGSDILQNLATDLYVDCSANWTALSQPLSAVHGTTPEFLIIGNYHDPATSYTNSTDLHSSLPSSRLLSYTGGGHSAFGKGFSNCVDQYATAYLVDGKLPTEDIICNDAQNSTSQAIAQTATYLDGDD